MLKKLWTQEWLWNTKCMSVLTSLSKIDKVGQLPNQRTDIRFKFQSHSWDHYLFRWLIPNSYIYPAYLIADNNLVYRFTICIKESVSFSLYAYYFLLYRKAFRSVFVNVFFCIGQSLIFIAQEILGLIHQDVEVRMFFHQGGHHVSHQTIPWDF